MSETQQEQHPPIHGTPERAIIKNDGIAQDIADQIQQVSEKKDAIMGKVITKGDSQEAPNSVSYTHLTLPTSDLV